MRQTVRTVKRYGNAIIEISKHIGILDDYSAYQIRMLWRKSGLTIKEVAALRYRSIDRAKQYCYGYLLSPKMRVVIGRFFIGVIHAKRVMEQAEAKSMPKETL